MDAKALIYQFDDVSVDLERFEVLKGVTRARLEPKAFEALVFLIEHRGRLVEKKELLNAVWKDAFVTENAMTRVIAQLRKALGDDSKQAKYIETVPTRGYRFIASVNERVGPDDAKAIRVKYASGDRGLSQAESSVEVPLGNASVTPIVQPDPKRRSRDKYRRTQIIVVCLMIVGLAVALSYFWIWGKPKPSSDGAAIRSIAVLPFKPLVVASRYEALEMGLTDALISKLSSIREIAVLPMSAVRKYTDPEQDAVVIGKTLAVDAVLDSSIQIADGKIRIRSQLIRVSDGRQMWVFEDDKDPSILDMQDAISERIASVLPSKLTADERKQLTKRDTDDPEIYKLYVLGLSHLDKRTVPDAELARDYFQQAVAKDENYAPAYGGICRAYNALFLLRGLPARDAMPKAKEAALTGLKIDDTLSELHSALGGVFYLYDWDWAGAEREFRRALDLDPRSARTHWAYAHFLKSMGRFDESLREIHEAIEEEPVSVLFNRDLAQILYYAQRYDEAIVQCNKALEMDPHIGAYSWLGLAYEQKGLLDSAVEIFLKEIKATGGSAQELSAYEAAYKSAGWRGYWGFRLERLKQRAKRYGWTHYGAIAGVYVRLGSTDLAIESLERGFRERSIGADLKVDPVFDSLRSDPRFKNLLRRMNLST